MSIYGITKDSELATAMNLFMKAESNGAMLYQALARVAKEQGYIDASEAFEKIAMQESVHSGFFAVLNGKYPQEFWKLVAGIQKAEANAESQIKPIIDAFRAQGNHEAANELSVFMDQEKQHGVILAELLQKHAPEYLGKADDDVMAALME